MNKATRKMYAPVRKIIKKSRQDCMPGYRIEVTGHPHVRLDFYLPKKKVAVDIDKKKNGKLNPQELQKVESDDKIKDAYCKKNGIKLVRYDGTNRKEVKDAVKK